MFIGRWAFSRSGGWVRRICVRDATLAVWAILGYWVILGQRTRGGIGDTLC